MRSDNQKKLAAIGAGIGVPLGISLAGLLALFALERRRHRKAGWEEGRSGMVVMTFPADQKTHREFYARSEVPDTSKYELTGTGGIPHELPSSSR